MILSLIPVSRQRCPRPGKQHTGRNRNLGSHSGRGEWMGSWSQGCQAREYGCFLDHHGELWTFLLEWYRVERMAHCSSSRLGCLSLHHPQNGQGCSQCYVCPRWSWWASLACISALQSYMYALSRCLALSKPHLAICEVSPVALCFLRCSCLSGELYSRQSHRARHDGTCHPSAWGAEEGRLT